MTQQTKPVSIWDVAPPPYEQYLYVSYGVDRHNQVGVYVWSERSLAGPRILRYPAADHDRAIKEIEKISGLIISTRRLLGLETPVREAQKL